MQNNLRQAGFNRRARLSFLTALGVPLRNFCWIHKSASHRTSADLGCTIVCRHTKDIKASVCGFQLGIGFYVGSNCRRSTMLNVDGGANADFPFFAIRQHGVGSSPLHEADHVGSGINWRQCRIVVVERMPMLNGFFRVTLNTDRNWF